jgi:hypothetical protein
METMTNNAKFTIMLHNQRHLIIKTSEGGNPHVVAECFLAETAAQIRQLLTDAADADLTLENAHKGE